MTINELKWYIVSQIGSKINKNKVLSNKPLYRRLQIELQTRNIDDILKKLCDMGFTLKITQKSQVNSKSNYKESRTCTKCGKNLPLTVEYFYKQPNSKTGFKTVCKECIKNHYEINKEKLQSYEKTYYEKNKEKLRDYAKLYWIENREKKLKYKKYYVKKYKNKISEYRNKWIVENKDKITIYRHTRRSRKRNNGGTYTPEQWEECKNFFDNKCAYTGELLTELNINVEHIKPISTGGSSYIWNICPSINYANYSKNNNGLEEWYRRQPYFSEDRLHKIYEWIEYAENKYSEIKEVI